MKARPVNAGQHQMWWREITDEEPLSALDLFGVTIWLAAENELVGVGVPPGYTSSVVE